MGYAKHGMEPVILGKHAQMAPDRFVLTVLFLLQISEMAENQQAGNPVGFFGHMLLLLSLPQSDAYRHTGATNLVLMH